MREKSGICAFLYNKKDKANVGSIMLINKEIGFVILITLLTSSQQPSLEVVSTTRDPIFLVFSSPTFNHVLSTMVVASDHLQSSNLFNRT